MTITNVRELFALWENLSAIAADIGVSYRTVAEWRRQGRVPPHYWGALVLSARQRGVKGVTMNLLKRLPTAEQVADFAGIISLWPTAAAMASDLGVPPSTVRAWKSRNHIPADLWRQVVHSATNRGIKGVTYATLSGIASRNGKPRGHNVSNHPVECHQ